MSNVTVFYPGYDVIDFEIKLIFLVKPFFTRPKTQYEKLNMLKTKRILSI